MILRARSRAIPPGRMRGMTLRLALAALTFACTLSGTALGQAAASAPAAAASHPRIGLVLSGGGARGLAHVGVLKALERAHVRIAAIAGITSSTGTSCGMCCGQLASSALTVKTMACSARAL